MRRMLIVMLAAGLALLSACSAGDTSTEAVDAPAAAPEMSVEDAGAGAVGMAGEQEAADADDGSAAGADEAAAREAGDASGAAAQALATSAQDRIVREGTVRLEVDRDGFDRGFDRVVAAAARLGGTVLSSDATSDDEGLTSGSVTVRVPADRYDALLTAVSEIGEVRERAITSQDVSAEFVDLEARLRHNEAQERFYLSLLERAESVEDAIAVQQRVTDIQQTIEQIKGRLSFLEERTDFSRLTVEIFETGSAYRQAGGGHPTFAHYWTTARDALVTVLGGALVVATVALPFAVGGLLVFLVVRRYLPAPRRAAAPAATPTAE